MDTSAATRERIVPGVVMMRGIIGMIQRGATVAVWLPLVREMHPDLEDKAARDLIEMAYRCHRNAEFKASCIPDEPVLQRALFEGRASWAQLFYQSIRSRYHDDRWCELCDWLPAYSSVTVQGPHYCKRVCSVCEDLMRVGIGPRETVTATEGV